MSQATIDPQRLHLFEMLLRSYYVTDCKRRGRRMSGAELPVSLLELFVVAIAVRDSRYETVVERPGRQVRKRGVVQPIQGERDVV